MLDKVIEKIFEIKYGRIITPRNLLENSKLPNYNYVRYEKSQQFSGLVVELECLCDDGVTRLFKYHFDFCDRLMQIVVTEPTHEILFDREVEMEKLLREYQNEICERTSLCVI